MVQVKYTQVAAQAVSLAELFEAQFEKGIEGRCHYRVELSAPDGPSTAGGKQALQHIKLIPEDGGPSIVVGSCHTVKQTAEIRMYGSLEKLHEQRFRGLPFPIDARTYRKLAQELAGFFTQYRIKVAFAEEALPPVPAPVESNPARVWTWVILGLVLVALGVIGFFFGPMVLHKLHL